MPNNMTAEQLNSWYKDFAKVLYKEVNIDVTRKEDLGRVQIHHIYQWDIENPEMALSTPQYAYIPHDGETYRVAPPPRSETKAYGEWLLNSQNPEVDTEQIRELYAMAKKGTLIVTGPEGGTDSYRQVQIVDGKPVISPRLNDIAFEDLPVPPLPVEKPKHPAAPAPIGEEPPRPKNPNPGFFSWLGYLFGMDTDYAKKKRNEEYWLEVETRQAENLAYEETVRVYEQALANWENQDKERMDSFRSQPLAVLNSIHIGNTSRWADDQLSQQLKDDAMFWMRKHQETPLGQLHRMTETALTFAMHEENVHTQIHNMMGPNFFLTPRFVQNKYLPQDFTAKNYTLPKENKGAIDLKKLADYVGFAAFTDPEVGSKLPIPGISREDATRQNFTHILNDLFTYGRKVNQYVQLIEPARNKGAEALAQYAEGNVAPVAKLFSDNLRAMNREAASLSCNTAHGYNCFSVLSKIVELIKKDPSLEQAMDLTPEEWTEVNTNTAYFNIAKKGLEATKDLMAYGRYQKAMSPEQVKEAVGDVLLANYLDSVSIAENDKWSKDLQETERFQNKFMENTQYCNATALKMEANKAVKEKKPNAKELMKQAKHAEDMREKTGTELNLMYLERPIPPTRARLTDSNWLTGMRQKLVNNEGMKKLLEQSPEELGKALADPNSVQKQISGEHGINKSEMIRSGNDKTMRINK